MDNPTLSSWLLSQAEAPVVTVIEALATAAIEIASVIEHAPITGQLGDIGRTNIQGETQKQLDVICDKIMTSALLESPDIAAMVSEEIDDLILNEDAATDARLVVCFDPLDGSSNIESNGTIGSIFSILMLENENLVSEGSVLQAAKQQVAAGYFLYGPSTLLVLTTGKSVAMFGIGDGEFMLVRDDITIPETTNEFAINMAYRQFWAAETTNYIDDCLLGENGPRGKNFNMRWMGSMVADIHRIFMRGGVFIYPALNIAGGGQGKLRFLYEVNPMAFLIETAGGKAMSGTVRSRHLNPGDIHQRAPFAAGSKSEIEHLLGETT